MHTKGGKGESESAQERQQTQEHDAGRKDKQKKLASGRRRPGGRRFAPGKYVGSRWKLRALQRVTAVCGEELGKRGKITIHKTGKENGGAGDILKSNHKQRSGEGEMYEVGIPPPHNSENPHVLVASINNNSI